MHYAALYISLYMSLYSTVHCTQGAVPGPVSVVARTPARQLPDRGWSEQDTATAVIHNTAMDFVILKVGWGPFCHSCVYYVMNNVEFS